MLPSMFPLRIQSVMFWKGDGENSSYKPNTLVMQAHVFCILCFIGNSQPYEMDIFIPVLEIQNMSSESFIGWSKSHTVSNEKKKERNY